MRILFTVNLFRATDTVDHIRKISVEISRTHNASLLSGAGFDAILYYLYIFTLYVMYNFQSPQWCADKRFQSIKSRKHTLNA